VFTLAVGVGVGLLCGKTLGLGLGPGGKAGIALGVRVTLGGDDLLLFTASARTVEVTGDRRHGTVLFWQRSG
jgi:hypothetical protein